MKIIFSFVLLTTAMFSFAQLPKPSSGSVRRLENMQSKYVPPRNVDVWLPDGYSASKKYAVLYMHDGQMLYDSNTTWNKQEWKVDEIVSGLLADKKIKDCIVVGVWNTGQYRHSEYFPQKPLGYLPASFRDSLVRMALAGGPRSDAYLMFLVKELKPFIDSSFAVYTDPANTFIMGSSMGGLISMYAVCEYPGVFGGAACLSTHWPGTFGQNDIIPAAFNRYLAEHLPSQRNHKIYFDYGTATLDSLYKRHQLLIDKTMKAKGYNSKNWITKEFTGEDHTEKAWGRRLDIPLVFLMGRKY
ncbi:MAG: alpha/beta hydrolase-fold protein [Chitinophagaceae bacterium]|nr:alpha/beta hydrolase-fold protein [Chitinophagaceae bacterium]